MPLNCVYGMYCNLLNFSYKEDVCIDISYIFAQSNYKNSSPTFKKIKNQLSLKMTKSK
jgi:hypothetical protein